MTVDYQQRFEGLITARARDRKIESFYSFDTPSDVVQHPNPIPLAGGTPNEGFFPVESIHLNLIDEPFQHLSYESKTQHLHRFDINTKEQVHQLNEEHTNHSYRYATNPDEIAIARGFQYGETEGFPQLKKFTKELVARTNKPAFEDWDVILTNGSGDSLHKVSDLLVENGGTILVEEFTFTPFNSTAINYGGTVVPVKINVKKEEGEPGIDPDYLDDLLTNWDSNPKYKDLPKPKSLYTIPTGQNPTGLSQSVALRKKILALAEKHDFIIIEDDPYGYIVLPEYGKESPYEDENFTVDEYLKILKPSYLTLDTSCRVLRLETFSKLFSPGLRLGFIVGNKYLIKKINEHAAVSTRSPSGVSQLIFNNIVVGWGGVEGWLKWALKIAKHYTRRRDILLRSLYDTASYKKGEFELIEPDAGMFVILYINLEKKFPDPNDWEKVLLQLRFKSITNGVEIVFGNRMASDLSFIHSTPKSNFIRLTFAAAPNDELLAEGGQRLGATISEFFEELNAGKYDSLKAAK
jgi:aromatic amino acid aminotransferase II